MAMVVVRSPCGNHGLDSAAMTAAWWHFSRPLEASGCTAQLLESEGGVSVFARRHQSAEKNGENKEKAN
jgi:hypothetical protein